jgi:tetratricopeptide (TPR) repeat protein
VELGKDDAFALCWAGQSLAYVVSELEDGAAFIERALALNPNLAEAWTSSGWVNIWLGAPELAIERFARVMRLSPVDAQSALMLAGTAHAYFYAGRYEEARSWAELRERPEYQAGLRISAASNALAGHMEEAKKACTRLRQLNPGLRVSNLRDVLGPYRLKDLAKQEKALRKAGLPE